MYEATVWLRIDGDARPQLMEAAAQTGPVQGECPACGSFARGGPTWLALRPSKREATLMIDGSRRGGLVEELIAHLQTVRADPSPFQQWMLQPRFEFSDRVEETTTRRALEDVVDDASGPRPFPDVPPELGESGPLAAADPIRRVGAPKPTTGHPSSPLQPLPDPASLFATPSKGTPIDSPAPPNEEAQSEPAPKAAPANGDSKPAVATSGSGVPRARPDAKSLEAGIPMMIGPDAAPPPVATMVRRDLGATIATLSADGGLVRLSARVKDDTLEQWEGAKIDARPVHLRGRGYPLVGVRLVAKHFGQVGCLDAVVDPGTPLAAEVFRALSERFAVEARVEGSDKTVTRMVVAEGLEPNAALCIESARGLLARGEFPPEHFSRAKAALEAEPVAQRLKTPSETISPGAYQHIVGGAEATRALEHLDRVSQKESLARLLEVDGLPMGEYDAIRRRVLEGSLAHGLCAPRRFWRRLVASGLARDLTDYANQLADNRSEHQGEEGDLEAEDAQRAWQEIFDLCRRKDLPVPEAVQRALGLDAPQPAEQPDDNGRPPPPPRPTAAAGEIRAGEINVAPTAGVLAPPPTTPSAADDLLRDPGQRLRAATDILQGRAHGDVDLVLEALEDFDTDELLAIMPDLSDLGPRAVPGLLAKLASDRREVRQAAVILLGLSMEPRALEHLADHLVREPTTVWVDVARSVGNFGASGIRALCQILRREAASPRESLAIDRIARALAEIALSDQHIRSGGDAEASGAAAVEALADATDPRVSTAARRALASLKDVKTSGAQIRGEIPLAEVTEVRGFARRAYEAIMVPELEVEAEG